MRTGRPVCKDTRYKMIIHTNGGHRYASTKVRSVGDDGTVKYAYRHWGTLLDGNRFHPGANYFYATLEERRKFIFPADWDLSEVSELASTRRPGRIAYQGDDVDRQYGATWFLDRVAEKTGLLEDLKSVFGGNMEMVEDVLTMAYFPFVENMSYNQMAQ